MNTNRSFLDSLNTGRKRRPGTSLEHISRTLQEIENRLDRAYDATGGSIARDDRGPSRRADYGREPLREEQGRPSSLRDLASELERSRRQESDFASIGQIAREVRALRGELAGLTDSGFRQEFAALRDELHRAHASAGDMRGRPDPAIEAMAARLEQISDAVQRLPETLPLHALDDNIRTLAGALDQFIARSGRTRPDLHELIDERLDEISRAIAAASKAPPFDPEPFERIEARIASLARQVEELVEDTAGAGIADRLALLGRKVDDIAGRIDLPQHAVEDLAAQVAAIAERLDRAAGSADPAALYHEIDQRFAGLSDLIDRRQSDSAEQGRLLFDDLKRQLAEMTARLDGHQPASGGEGEMLAALDARFADLSARLETHPAGAAAQQSLAAIETRLEALAERLQESFSLIADIDPQVIRGLQEQIAGLARHIAQPAAGLPDFEDLGPRLARIERSIAENREAVVEAARRATEETLGSMAGAQPVEGGGSGLSEELKALEALTRRAEDRNARTFEAIHDTLLKIVDRLAVMEGDGGQPDPMKIAVGSAPSIEPGDEPELFDREAQDDPKPRRDTASAAVGEPQRRTPAEAAAAAAVAALSDEEEAKEQVASGRRSMLGELTRAFGGRRERTVAAARVEPAVEDEGGAEGEAPALDTEHMNEPLEPGSGAPDLNAIMRRVRDESAQRPRDSESDAAKSDFIAAARRAAQAAAAEAETLKRKKGGEARGSGGRFSVGGLLRSRRKSALLAVAAVAIAAGGLGLSRTLPVGGERQAEPVASSSESAPARIAAETRADARPTAPAETAVASAEPADDLLSGRDAVRRVDSEDDPVETVAAAEPAKQDAQSETADDKDADATGEDPAGASGQPAVEADAHAAAPVPAPQAETVEPDMDTTTASTVPDASASSGPEADALAAIPAAIGPGALRRAAASGDPRAMFEIADRYSEGRGVEADVAKAAEWYERAAEAGLAPAQYRIGNSYEKGIGVERDIGKARTWYRLAAEQGNASAMHNLGVLYAMGAGGTADNEAAAQWFMKAAELGVKDSQFNLGILSAKGVGVPKDLEEAYKWFALVAGTGDSDAAAKRDEVAKTLDAEALKQAKAKAELWKAKPLDRAANVVDVPDAWTGGEVTAAKLDEAAMKKAVTNIQRILNKNGYSAGPADGIMGGQTKAAIMAFQKDNGMDATGAVDKQLVQALLEQK